tara:strand:- start:69 stop:602 length:534 start_codon:yes stop_codon:yes gene_type:complete
MRNFSFTRSDMMSYPDIKAIVSGYFNPLDKTRCLVCGKQLSPHPGCRTCSHLCFGQLLKIQRLWSAEDCDALIETAQACNDPRLHKSVRRRYTERRPRLKAGDKVCWAAAFLSQIADYTSAAASRRGTIITIGKPSGSSCGSLPNTDLARVKWDDGPEHWCKLACLWDATRRHLEPR